MKNKNLPRDLTFEQFKALAEQEPDMSAECVYELECYEIADSARPLYPKFKIMRSPAKFMFRTLEDAETYMRRLVSGDMEGQTGIGKENIYCFYISRIFLGRPTYVSDLSWLYDSDGVLLDWQYLPFAEADREGLHNYFGRQKERIRFHKGDIVEVSMFGEVHLAVVVSEEPDIEWCWGLYRRCMADDGFPYYSCDDSDFSAIVVTEPDYGSHEHISPLSMMKPRFPVPDDLREYFRKCCFEPEDCDNS